jgi:hypothetical protein
MTPSIIGLLAVLVGGAWVVWQSYARRLAVGLGSASVLPAVTVIEQASWLTLATVVVLTGGVAWHRWARTSATVMRWGARSRRKSGVASSLDILRWASGWSIRRRTATVRPSFAELPRLRRWQQVATTDVGVQLCRVGLQRVWASIEDVTLVFGGPRTGKSGWLAGRIIDAPGAALVTSTRTDLHQLTAELRGGRGPVFVFNAVGLAGLDSTITFDPLTGCESPVTAAERATDMLGATVHHGHGAGGDRAFWEAQARRVLTALLHTAALGRHTMRDLLDWVSDPDAARERMTAILRHSPEPGFLDEITQFVDTNDRTRSSITSSVMPALSWMTSPAAKAAASGDRPFNVDWLLERRATIYLLGAEETYAAPLVCALTGHIAREARRIASRCPAGRLDPPLGLFLDEAALISPVPLHSWTADMGGRGVTIVAAFQSRAQLIDRYGPAKAAVILNNAAAKLLFGGTGDRDDLDFWSTLAGDRDEPIRTTDMHGRVASRTSRKTPVLAPAQLANLPAGRVVVYRRGIAAVVGRAQMAWRRVDVRSVQHPHAWDVRVRTALRTWAARASSWSRRFRRRPKTVPLVAVPDNVIPLPTGLWEPTPAVLPVGEWGPDSGANGQGEPGSWN